MGVDGSMLDVEANFIYLGDDLDAGGGSLLAIATRCCVAWGKVRKLLPVLTTKQLSLKTHGSVLVARVRKATMW